MIEVIEKEVQMEKSGGCGIDEMEKMGTVRFCKGVCE